jgi:hypothetical protein
LPDPAHLLAPVRALPLPRSAIRRIEGRANYLFKLTMGYAARFERALLAVLISGSILLDPRLILGGAKGAKWQELISPTAVSIGCWLVGKAFEVV